MGKLPRTTNSNVSAVPVFPSPFLTGFRSQRVATKPLPFTFLLMINVIISMGIKMQGKLVLVVIDRDIIPRTVL